MVRELFSLILQVGPSSPCGRCGWRAASTAVSDVILGLLGAPLDPRHEKAVEAAYAAFLDFGVRRTSMADVAKRAGISEATLYRWFANKDALVRAVTTRQLQAFVADIEAHLDPTANALDQMTAIAVRLVLRAQQQPLIDRMFHTEPETILPAVTRSAGPTLELAVLWLTAHLARLRDEGKLGDIDVAVASEVIVRLGWSIFLVPTPLFDPSDPKQTTAVMRECLRRILELPPA